MLTRFRGFLFTTMALGLAIASFGAGWHLSRRPVGPSHHSHYLGQPGDADAQVRAEVLVSLRAFQAGYTKRDPSALPAFMDQLFLKDHDTLLLGTDEGEWIEGYQPVGEFIANDWRYWGDVRLEVDRAIISAAGDVAWVTTVGTVSTGSSRGRAIRFTAVLARTNSRWLFRHIQFQWDDNPASLREQFRESILGGYAP